MVGVSGQRASRPRLPLAGSDPPVPPTANGCLFVGHGGIKGGVIAGLFEHALSSLKAFAILAFRSKHTAIIFLKSKTHKTTL